MRTARQVVAAAEKVIGLPTVYVEGCGHFFCLLPEPGTHSPLACAMFNEDFLMCSEKEQDAILQHEKGHLYCMENEYPAHMAMERVRKRQTIPSNDEFYAQEAEADFYMARQVGLNGAIKVLKNTIPYKDERKIRIRGLKGEWERNHHENQRRSYFFSETNTWHPYRVLSVLWKNLSNFLYEK